MGQAYEFETTDAKVLAERIEALRADLQEGIANVTALVTSVAREHAKLQEDVSSHHVHAAEVEGSLTTYRQAHSEVHATHTDQHESDTSRFHWSVGIIAAALASLAGAVAVALLH